MRRARWRCCWRWPAALRLRAHGGDDAACARGRALRFPRDHGAHPGARIEWWYATGWLDDAGDAAPLRLPDHLLPLAHRPGRSSWPSRFARAPAAVCARRADRPGRQRHLHAQRIARWSGDEQRARARRRATTPTCTSAAGAAARAGAAGQPLRAPRSATPTRRLRLRPGAARHAAAAAAGRRRLLAQGPATRRRPATTTASRSWRVQRHAARAAASARRVRGRAWLDHEWSESLLPAEAVGWDWIGINLDDGGALTAFRLRRADGSALWAGGSHRAARRPRCASSPPTRCASTPRRIWTSAGHRARATRCSGASTRRPARFEVRALLDAQELDSRASTGTVYWEGLSELLDARGRARRPRLPRDDRLRRAAAAVEAERFAGAWPARRPSPEAARRRPRRRARAAGSARRARSCGRRPWPRAARPVGVLDQRVQRACAAPSEATPMLTVVLTPPLCQRSVCRRRARGCARPRPARPAGRCGAGRRSTPRRRSGRAGRAGAATAPTARAISRSSRSPARWPCRSLTLLKWSASISSSAAAMS